MTMFRQACRLPGRRQYATEALATTIWPANLTGDLPKPQVARPNPFSAVHEFLMQFDEPPTTIEAPIERLGASSEASTSAKTLALPAAIFAHPCHPSLFHLLVRQHLAGLRQGTHSNLSRHEVSYSNRKIRKQKGLGKARLGDRGSPMLRGGGRAFAKKPKDYSFHVPRKMVAKGVCGALSMRLAMGELSILESVGLDWKVHDIGRTRYLQQIFANKGWSKEGDRGTLFLLGQEILASEEGRLLERASRNLPQIGISDSLVSLNVYELLRPSRLLLDTAAVEEIIDQFAPLSILEEAQDQNDILTEAAVER